MKSTDYAFLELTGESEAATKVTWGFFGKMKYPMNMSLVFMDMDALLGKDLENGLTNLKKELEK
jgi:hypothetical protein